MTRKYRIKEVYSHGKSTYFPQYKDFLVWKYFRKLSGDYIEVVSVDVESFARAYINNKIVERKAIEETSKLPSGTRYLDVK